MMATLAFNKLKQPISEPTYVLPTSNSCIDLTFTNQPNIVMDIGVFPPIHQNCWHQIVFAKMNLNIFYLLPYTRHTWDIGRANCETISNEPFRLGKSFVKY